MNKPVLDFLKPLVSEEVSCCLQDALLLEAPVFHTGEHLLELKLQLKEPLAFEKYQKLLHELRMKLHVSVDLTLQSESCTPTLELVRPYASYLAANDPVLRCFTSIHPTLSAQKELRYATTVEQRYHEMNLSVSLMEKALAKAGIKIPVIAELDEAKDIPDIPTIAIPLPKSEGRSSNDNTGAKKSKSYSRQAVSLPIRDLETGMSSVTIKGRVFEIENKLLKSGQMLQLFYLSDDDDAIVCKRFERSSLPWEEMETLKKGQYVEVTGSVAWDNFNSSEVFNVQKLQEVKAPKRQDMAAEKRIEWHCHTNFSEMDGVCSAEDLIQHAWDWGMDAIGICDHNVVQAFPMCQHKVTALKKADPNRNFKVLYGCEMSMVDAKYRTTWNIRDQKLDDATFVVFDLETTGLSNRLDDIIEFGAVKMEGGQVVETKQFFVNPNRTLPASIMNLTNISQIDVDTAKPIEDHWQEICDFVDGAILVAHNAVFDMGMLNAAARKLGKPEFDNPVIDTLPCAYSMLDLRSYRLGSVCKHYGVAYDGEGAHRADYDARVLGEVFLHMLGTWGPDATLQTVADLDTSTAMNKNREKHITVFAKNKAGLKELFELVTLSHTKYLKYNPNATNVTGLPRIPKSVLQMYHDKGNLLFGSSCQNGQIFDLAHTKSKKDLTEAMGFYDYIEIQPLDVYKNLLDDNVIHGVDELKKILGFIIESAKEAGKPVIASGDVHYCDPRQKRVRDIYINAKAIGNSRHPLYIRNEQRRLMESAPNQHFLTTVEMLTAFDWLDDKTRDEIVLENPKKLAAQTEELFPVKDRLYPPDIEGSDQKLRDICYETAIKQYGEPLPEPVKSRLDRELNAIIGAGYYVVYYISHLLVKKSNEDGYLVGSRGSVGSSFVATMSGITEVNPLKPHYLCPKCHHLEWIEDGSVHSGFDLPDKNCPECGEKMKGDGQDIPFETFLGFEGDKVPDIDLNFSGDYQANAHAFTRTIFGDDHVFRAGTVGTVQEKTAYGYVKGYEEEMHLESTPFSEAKRRDLAKECEGVKRTTGQHPGGIVVVPMDMDIHDFTPVQYPANNPYAEWKTTHFDFHQIHDNILKFDILGHVDPTAMKMLERITGIDVTTIPMNDPDTMAIFSCCDSLGLDTTLYKEKTGAAGIPEFGTPFVRGILELTKPTTFAELVSISGLSHGTDVWLNNAQDLIDNGTCTLREVIGCRDDIMVDLMRYGLPPKASFTIMESVRKGKGLKPEWEELMKENNVPDWYMDSCRKIKYMFPKAHAVAYVTMAVRIAWFKVHRPRAYYCQYFSIRCDAYDIAVMTSGKAAIEKRMYEIEMERQDKTRKVEAKELAIYDTLELAYEMEMRGYHISPLSISRSAATEFILDPDDERSIIPPFTTVDALGENVAKSIVKAREEKEFLSKEDLANRTQLSKTLIEKLDRLGALEGLDEKNQLSLF